MNQFSCPPVLRFVYCSSFIHRQHFIRFETETRKLPVLWHQSLLVFVQRYKTTITKEQKEALKPVLKRHAHVSMTEDVRRELFGSRSRGEKAPAASAGMMDDLMM